MNRIEKILEEVKVQLAKYPDDRFWVDTYGKQVKFFKWLLEEVNEAPTYELHERQVRPSVWGMGDVSYHMDIQLQKLTTRSNPITLVFDYQSSAPTANLEKSK